jgi:hypothetical protein
MFKQYLTKRKQKQIDKIYDQLETHLATIATPLDRELLSLEVNELKDKYMITEKFEQKCRGMGDRLFKASRKVYTGDEKYFRQLTEIKPLYNRLEREQWNDGRNNQTSRMDCEVMFENGYSITIMTSLDSPIHEIKIWESKDLYHLHCRDIRSFEVVFGDLEALKNVLDEYVEKERK